MIPATTMKMMTHDKNKRSAIENIEKTSTSFRSCPCRSFSADELSISALMQAQRAPTADHSTAQAVSFPNFSRTLPTRYRRFQGMRQEQSNSHKIVCHKYLARSSTRS